MLLRQRASGAIDRRDMACLYSWGANNCGQLGDNSTEDKLLPTAIDEDSGKTQNLQVIGGGGGFSFLLEASGQLLTCGNNDRGQQGKADKANVLLFTPLPSLAPTTKILKVTAGWDFILAITGDGTILSWGSNFFGQLGRQSSEGQNFDSVPRQVTLGNPCAKAADVDAGLRHAVALTDSQDIFTWGQGKKGQLGQVSDTGEPIVKSASPAKADIATQEKLTSVVAGMYHSGALTANGSVFLWGCNKYGQCCRDPANASTVTKPTLVDFKPSDCDKTVGLTSGWTHLTARTERGHLYSWGRSDLGQLGRASRTKLCDHIPGQILLKPVTAQASGSEHNLALTADGDVYSWGWNEHGICGTGDEANVYEPHRISTFIGKRTITIGCGAGHSFCHTSGNS